MFEVAELGSKVSRADYDAAEPELRTSLLQLQRALRRAPFSVLVLLHGVSGAGRTDTLLQLAEWLDARYVQVHALEPPPGEEARERPTYWRYWMCHPPRGTLGVFAGSWYTEPLRRHARGEMSDAELVQAIVGVRAHERTLTDDGMLVIKIWLHLSHAGQKARLRKLESSKETRWQVTREDWDLHERYSEIARTAEWVLRETSTAAAPWTIVEAADTRHRRLTIARHLEHALREHLTRFQVPITSDEPDPDSGRPHPVATGGVAAAGRGGALVVPPHANDEPLPPPPPRSDSALTILDTIDLSQKVDRATYDRELPKLQGQVNRLMRKAVRKRVGTILCFEGWDAAGKGGAIRRVTQALDPRLYRVIPVAAPTEEERAHHYLWRFWRELPRRGRMTVYDRSWYGRVLVEKVERFATAAEVARAYGEINEFEAQLVEHGTVVLKFWVHISRDEQLRRFQDREATPWKRHKLTEEDWRNRDKWDRYAEAVCSMVGLTSTEYAPWTLVSGECKRAARLATLRTVVAALKRRLKD